MRLLYLPALIALALAFEGCARSQVEARRSPPWAALATSAKGGRRPRGHATLAAAATPGDFVVASLKARGLRFGTDGSLGALWGYMRASHTVVPPADARPGDVLFFRAAPAAASAADCGGAPDDVGIVERVDPDGRLTFVERKDGRTHTRFADPVQPLLRRDAGGRIRNSFLRPKRVSDPPDLPIFAGEMLCGAARPKLD